MWCDIAAPDISHCMSNQHKWKLESIHVKTRSNVIFNKVTSENWHIDISLETFWMTSTLPFLLSFFFFSFFFSLPFFFSWLNKRQEVCKNPQETWWFLIEYLFLISIYFPAGEWLSKSMFAFNLGKSRSKSAVLWLKCYACLFSNWHDRWQMTEALLGQVKSLS